MHGDDLAEHQVAAAVLVRTDNLIDLAFEIDWRVGHVRRSDALEGRVASFAISNSLIEGS